VRLLLICEASGRPFGGERSDGEPASDPVPQERVHQVYPVAGLDQLTLIKEGAPACVAVPLDKSSKSASAP